MSDAQPTTDIDTGSPAESPLTRDQIFHLLQCRRRRDALRYLRQHDGPVRMRDLAEQVAAWEHDTTVQQLASAQRQRVYIPLYQTHLPKLDDAGIIDYQQSRGVVERNPRADLLDPYLEAVHGPDTERAGDVVTSDAHAGEMDAAGDASPDDSHPATRGDSSVEASGVEASGVEASGVEASDGVPNDGDGSSPDWTRYYLGASGLGFALVGGTAVGLPAFSSLSGTTIGTLISVIFAALTTARSIGARVAGQAQ